MIRSNPGGLMKTKMMMIALTLAFVGSASASVSKTLSFNTGVYNFSLEDAQYDLIPTKTVTRPIPGCVEGGEAGNVCEETVVVESQPVIRVYLSYSDTFFPSNERPYSSVTFDVADFSAAQVELLKSVYPGWKHPFSNVNRQFAAENFTLEVKTVRKTIRIVDMQKSKICPIIGEVGLPDPNCREELVYKESWTNAVEATVTKK